MKKTWRRDGRNSRRFTGRLSVPMVLIAMIVVSVTEDLRAQQNTAVGTHIGQTYPDFLLPKLGGGFGRLSDYRGNKVLLMHFASW